MAPSYPRILFTRQQIGDLTGIDNSTLNYWMREGLLRPSEGGEGRGSHRQFSFTEINIAGILNEIRQFGVGLPALKGLADRFHHALDWMAAKGVTFENAPAFLEYAFDRQTFLKDGHLSIDATIYRKRWPDRPAEAHGEGQFAQVHITWEEAVELYILPTLLKHEYPEHEQSLKIIESLTVEDWRGFQTIRSYYYFATLVAKTRYEGFSPYYFYRDDNGDWMMTPNDALVRVSVIAVDLAELSYRIWSRLS